MSPRTAKPEDRIRVRGWIIIRLDPKVDVGRKLRRFSTALEADLGKTLKPRSRGLLQKYPPRGHTLFELGDDDFVIVRADLVWDQSHASVTKGKIGASHVIVPIDAISETKFNEAKELVEDLIGGTTEHVWRVDETFPYPPQRANSYVPSAEHRACPLEELSPPGRHPKSPGANPWG